MHVLLKSCVWWPTTVMQRLCTQSIWASIVARLLTSSVPWVTVLLSPCVVSSLCSGDNNSANLIGSFWVNIHGVCGWMLGTWKILKKDVLRKKHPFQFPKSLQVYYHYWTSQQFLKLDKRRFFFPFAFYSWGHWGSERLSTCPRSHSPSGEKQGCSLQLPTPGPVAFPLHHTICCSNSGVHTPVRSQFSVCPVEPALEKQVPTC